MLPSNVTWYQPSSCSRTEVSVEWFVESTWRAWLVWLTRHVAGVWASVLTGCHHCVLMMSRRSSSTLSIVQSVPTTSPAPAVYTYVSAAAAAAAAAVSQFYQSIKSSICKVLNKVFRGASCTKSQVLRLDLNCSRLTLFILSCTVFHYRFIVV